MKKERNYARKNTTTFSRGGAHRSPRDYNRKWEVDMDEVYLDLYGCPDCPKNRMCAVCKQTLDRGLLIVPKYFY